MIKRVIAVVVGGLLVVLWISWLRVLGGYGSFVGAFLDTLGSILLLLAPVVGMFLMVYGLWGDDS